MTQSRASGTGTWHLLDPCSFDGVPLRLRATYGSRVHNPRRVEVIARKKVRGGRDESKRQGLNLSGSWQQGHSATYNTPSRI